MAGVAACTIFKATVIEDEWCPIGGVMTALAIFAGMWLGCFMAAGAVGVTDVVEHGRFPIFGVVTSSALKMVVGSWIVFQVAGNTVVVADVIKCSLSPIFCVAVTVGTGARFAGFVGCLEGVANTYDWKGSMEQLRLDNLGVMAWWVIGCVAGEAFHGYGVFVFFYVPAFGIAVAVGAKTGVMIARGCLPVTGIAFGNGRMVIYLQLPAIEGMAVGTFARKMVGIVVGWCGLVTAGTVGVGVGVTAVFMTL